MSAHWNVMAFPGFQYKPLLDIISFSEMYHDTLTLLFMIKSISKNITAIKTSLGQKTKDQIEFHSCLTKVLSSLYTTAISKGKLH